MRVELGAPVVLVDGVETLWHLAAVHDGDSASATVCGLAGVVFAYGGPIRRRRLCRVCAQRAPALLHNPAAGPPDELAQRRRRGGRPRGSVRRLSEPQVRLLHRLYQEERLSCYELARRIDWQRLGYASTKSAAMAIWTAFRELGLETRSQSASTSLRNHRHGRSTRAVRAAGGDFGPGGYRAWLKRQRDAYRPTCAGVRTQYPRKGQQCKRPALVGSDYCWAHDPALAGERERHLAEMRRRRQPRVGEPLLEASA